MFKIIKELQDFKITLNNKTLHALTRLKRLKHNSRSIYKMFLVDKQHKNGLEVHVIFTDATVLIFNYNSSKLITVLNDRVNQLLRYSIKDKSILKYARLNQVKKLNN